MCKITTGKSYDELLQHDNKMRIWTQNGKTKIMYEWVTKHNVNANDEMYACVTLHDTNVNDIIHDCVAPHDAHTCNPHPLSIVRTFSGSLVVFSSSRTHALGLKMFAPLPSSTWSSTCVWSLHFDSPFLLLALPSAPFPLPQLHEFYGKPAQLLQ